jgi:cytochrome c-type biogenesis protein CcmE
MVLPDTDMRVRYRFIIGAGLIVAAITYLIVAAIQNTSEYYLTVNEVSARRATLAGQTLRVAGRVKPGTISWDPRTLTLKFAVMPPPAQGKSGVTVTPVAQADPATEPSFPVICKGEPKPDMFAANRDVIVQGTLGSDGVIAATQVLTKCPSKYVPSKGS